MEKGNNLRLYKNDHRIASNDVLENTENRHFRESCNGNNLSCEQNKENT